MPSDCTINRYNKDFVSDRKVKKFEVNRAYRVITYDSVDDSFWAASDGHRDIIYKLDPEMREIDRIHLKNIEKDDEKNCSPIMGLSFNCENNTLIVVYRDFIAEVSKECGGIRILFECAKGHFISVLSVAPYYIIAVADKNEQKILVYNQHKELITTLRIPDEYIILDILFNPCEKGKDKHKDKHEDRHRENLLYVLTIKHNCYPRILVYNADFLRHIHSCNFKICKKDCNRECEKPEMDCDCDIICSIAMMEAALAHILNAEGEKLQKGIQLAQNVDELLELNRSITKTVINATLLENILFLKLQAFLECCRDDNEKPKK
jgi:hypothetical protein